jgi:hypothetical protein
VLRDEITAGLKEAMKAQDKRRVSTLRLISAAIKDRDIEARGLGRDALTDEELLGLLQKMIKQRQESLEIYEKAGRADLATQEREEIEIITTYLPKQMSEDEVQNVCASLVKEIDATGLKDMGKCMATLKERYAGQMDFAKASAAVKGILAG